MDHQSYVVNEFNNDHYENHITETTSIPNKSIALPYAVKFLIFMIMGSGANWVMPTALSQEIPYFEVHQPEGLCIATYMNATVNIGLLFMILYVYIYKNVYKIPYNISVPSLLSISPFGCVLTALTYQITVGNASILLYLSCIIAGMVGALSSVIMSPFLMSYENNFISAARSGGSAMILLTALLALAQSPGNTNPRFSVSVYMGVFACILAFPIFAYYMITKYNIGLRPVEIEAKVTNIELSYSLSFSSNKNKKATDDLLAVLSNPLNNEIDRKLDNHIDNETDKEESKVPHSVDYSNEDIPTLYPESKNFIDQLFDSIIDKLIPDSFKKTYPWLPRALPYMFAVAFVDFNNWGVLTAALPFAMADADPSGGQGQSSLALAFEFGALCLVLGDTSTTLWKVPFRYSMVVFSICCLVIYIASFQVSGYNSSAGSPILVILYCITQYLEAHTLTSSYRACAIRFPIQFREDASRAVGISDQVATTTGAIVSTIIISSIAKC